MPTKLTPQSAERHKKKKLTDYLFSLPAVVIVALVTQIPFVITIIFSTLRWNMVRPDQGIRFADIQNFVYYAQQGEFWQVVWQTIWLTVLALAGCTIFGFLLSLLLDHDIPGKNIARTLILGPFFVMSTASGVVWKTTILNTTFGWYGVIARAFGAQPVDFISYASLPLIAFLFIWQWLPFFVLSILSGLQGISQDVLESARIDGCRWWTLTFKIKLPLIFHHIQVAIMLGLVFVVKEFGLILTVTAGGPGTSSYNLPFYVYKIIFNASNVGRAAAVAVVTVLLTMVAVNLLYRALRKRRDLYA